MAQRSAGILLYRRRHGGIEVLLVHPGGPFWAKKDEGVWSIPKGLYEPDEAPLAAARREFAEETGASVEGEASRDAASGSTIQGSFVGTVDNEVVFEEECLGSGC